MSVLNEICQKKRTYVEKQKTRISLEELKAGIETQAAPKGFIQHIQSLAKNDPPALITEVKKASPSKGLIRENFDPAAIAKSYQNAGAACLSVLTDEPYFQGTDEHFIQARDAIEIPMIRKDFMLETYQIFESRAMGADCILLIIAALNDDKARELYELSTQLGMDVLVEIHNAQELERSLKLNPTMIGVNNRNLKTLEVDIQTSFDLVDKIPDSVLKIAESGLADFETLDRLQAVGFSGFLVGESLMRQQNIEQAVRDMRGNHLTQNKN